MKGKTGKLLIFELILCYMVLLVLISHARGPDKFQRDSGGPVWTASDLQCFDEMELSKVEGTVLHMESATFGRNIVFQREIKIDGVDGVFVGFLIDCPQEYQGTHLAVDLYNEAAGYNEGGARYMHTLSQGKNEISCRLFVGENAPDTALIRIFTADLANYDIQELQIYTLHKTEKVGAGMWIALLLAVAATAVTGAVGWNRRKNGGQNL